jgi:hypothetical protein
MIHYNALNRCGDFLKNTKINEKNPLQKYEEILGVP